MKITERERKDNASAKYMPGLKLVASTAGKEPSANDDADFEQSLQHAHSSAVVHHKSANKVQKKQAKGLLKKAKKRQEQARKALQKTMYDLHSIPKSHYHRIAARKWVHAQLNSQLIAGPVANELFHFLKDRKHGGPTKGAIEMEDLSKDGKATWARYLEEMAIQAGVKLNVEAFFAGAGIGEAMDALEVAEEEYDGVMLSQGLNQLELEAAEEIEDEEEGGVILGELAFRPKQ